MEFQVVDHDIIEQIQVLQTPRDKEQIREFLETIYKLRRDNILEANIMTCKR